MEDRSFYVYAHYRLDTMEPFYIGKGKGNRKDIISRNHMHDRISKKHGHAVVILYDNLTEEEAFFYERETIEDLVLNEGYEISCKNCGEFTGKFSYLTNFSFGGEGSCGYIHNEEAKEKMSKAHSGKNNAMYGKNAEDYMTPEAIAIKREKIKKSIKEYYEDPESRKKQSVIGKKRFQDEKERNKCSNPGEKNGKAKSVYCKELNVIFSYAKLAAEYCINVLNIKIGQIDLICNGKRKSTGKLADGTKLTWNWLEDVEQEILDNAEYSESKHYEEIIKAK